MKKLVKIMVFTMLILLTCLSINSKAVTTDIKRTEYSDKYKEYLNLSDEEKKNVIEPSRYEPIYSDEDSGLVGENKNVFRSMKAVRNSMASTYDLRDIIQSNLKIKNQETTNTCWAFASIGALESNLALQDYRVGNTNTLYDYSERHMTYGIIRNFNNNQINKYGFTRKVEDGGNFYHAETYLTNGMGAVNESEMPFEDNMNDINISEIQNKNVSTTLYDTVLFEDLTTAEKDELMSKMKQFITEYGGIYAQIHGAQLISDSYNNSTGAIYCNSAETYPIDHAVTIIGWDDNYSKDNFNAKSKPENDGAWIIKNSWGEEERFDLAEVKESFYNQNVSELNGMGYNSPDAVPNDLLQKSFEATYGEGKVSIDGDELVLKIGNDGYMYISYDDANVYTDLFGIEKATDTKDYDNIYQHDLLGAAVSFELDENKLYLANRFTRNASDEEVLDKISVYTIQEATFKVYVNPNNDDFSELQEAQIKAGDSITLEPGYHVIELANPISLTGDSFLVAVSMETNGQKIKVMTENKLIDPNVEVNLNESFYTDEASFASGEWLDWNEVTTEENHANISIKAFTQNVEEPIELTKIEITKAPNKTRYTAGENFSSTGMEVTATYSDSSTKKVTGYTITNGEDLKEGQTEVTISYTENRITKTVNQAITVTAQDQGGDETDKEPVLSDLNNMRVQANNINVYFYKELEQEEYMQLQFTISNIVHGNAETDYTYYYYLSENDSEENIQNWTQINNSEVAANDGSISITFTVNTKDIGNYDELVKADRLYLYIREVGRAGDTTLEQTKINSIDVDERSIGYYIDNEYAGTLNKVIDSDINLETPDRNQSAEISDGTNDGDSSGNNTNNNSVGNSGNTDNTTAGGRIPQTGVISIGLAILAIAGIGIFAYVKYKNMLK